MVLKSIVQTIFVKSFWISLGIILGSVFLSLFSILSLSIIQCFILLATMIYIPFLYQIQYDLDFSKYSIISGTSILISFQISRGLVSSIFILPWIISNIIIFAKNPPKLNFAPLPFLELSSKLYSLAAPGALLISRYGLRPLNFTDRLIELTAIHFHYAGIMIPILMSKIYEFHSTQTLKVNSYFIGSGTTIVALGISFGKFKAQVGIFAVIFFAIPLIIISFSVLKTNCVVWIKSAHGILIVTMLLAMYYAAGVSFSLDTISISDMIITHGILNGLGFIPLSIFGWHLQTK